MESKHFVELDTDYDVAGLISTAKANLCKFVAKIVIFTILLILSILAIIFYGSYMLVFIGSIIMGGMSIFFCGKLIKNFAFSDYSSACGEITDIHKEIKIVDTMSVGGINPFGTRKFDNYKKNEVRLGIFIQNGDQVRGYFFNEGTEEHAKYYETKGEAMHIWGTHFPVKLKIGKEQWLCPVCGEFNVNEEKTCARCKRKILK